MLDAYIIDAIQKEQQERERQAEEGRRIWLEIPGPEAYEEAHREETPVDEEADRGVLIIPLYPEDETDSAA